VQNRAPPPTLAPQDGHDLSSRGWPQALQNLPEASAPHDEHFMLLPLL